MKRLVLFGKSVKIENDLLRLGIILGVFAIASLACVSSGDVAPTSTSFGETNATISGTVYVGGSVASGARVATDRGEYSTTTGSDGKYTLNVAGDKTYNVFATYNGYKTVVAKQNRIVSGDAKTVNLTFTTPLASGEKTYMGSSQCKLCHATQYNRWSNAPHRYGISAPGDSPGILSTPKTEFEAGYALSATSAFSAYGSNAPVLTKSGDTYYISIGTCSYPVTYAMGCQWKQRYITTIGEAHYILPIQYNVATSEWVTYNASDWYSGVTPKYSTSTSLETDIYKKNSWERKCIGCHSVTGILSLEYSASSASGISQHKSDWLEKGVGCEACHGPASAHVWANGSTGPSSDPYIVNPAKLSRDRQLDVCGQCHSRGVSVGTLGSQTGDTYTLEYWYNGTRTFHPGDTLVAYYTDGGSYYADSSEVKTSKGHHQQWNDLWQSAHLASNAAITTINCGSCHDNHGPVGYERQLKLDNDDNSLCLSCHGADGAAEQKFATDSAVLDHTGSGHITYNPQSGPGRCSRCHMPTTAKSAINQDIHSHTFRVVTPRAAWRFAMYSPSDTIPSSCNQKCHNPNSSKGTSWGDPNTAAAMYLGAQWWDSTVEQPGEVMPDSGYALIKGKVSLSATTDKSDTLGIWVTVLNTNYGTVTNRDGTYGLCVSVPGTYTVQASKYNYETASLTIYVSTNHEVKSNQNLTLTAGAALFSKRPLRCGACHGGIWGAQWRRSGFEGVQQSEAEGVTDLAAGHSLIAKSPAGNTSCIKCHEGSAAISYLISADTDATYLKNDPAARRGQTCEVCHMPHPNAGDGTYGEENLRQVQNSTGFDTGYFYVKNTYGGTDSSMNFPPAYRSAACIMCHNQRTAPTDSGTGVKVSGGNYVPVSTPHVGNNSEGFFGIRSGLSGASLNFDSAPGFVPANSSHSDTLWGGAYKYQAYVYVNGAPKLVSQDGAPITRSTKFQCISCHMFRQNSGTYGSGSNAAQDAGHSWKPDIRACGVCHDPSYILINPYSATYTSMWAKSGAGDVGYWGTDSWGVSASGKDLGFDRPVTALPHQKDNGDSMAGTTARPAAVDGVSNDYDGNGRAEGAHTEANKLFERVMAAFEQGTYGTETSGILVLGSSVGLGDTFTGSYPYFKFNATRAATGVTNLADYPLTKLTQDEMRIAWNLVFLEHDETNLGVHNLRFAVETLRKMWQIMGQLITNDPNWSPPGDDY